MILTCPSCSASYNVPTEAIGINGRSVRCKKCRHEWFQDGEKKALEDLMNLIESTEIEVDDIGFDEDKPKVKRTAPPKKEKVDALASLKAVAGKLGNIFPENVKNYLFSGGNRGFSSHFASFMVSLAVFTCFIFVLVAQRVPITHVLPSLTTAYEAAGFPITNYARLNPEDTFIIDRVAIQTEGEKREIIGSLINLASQNVKVPTFKLDYLDSAGKVIEEQTQILPIQILEKEVSYNFTISVSEAIPPDFAAVKITFVE